MFLHISISDDTNLTKQQQHFDNSNIIFTTPTTCWQQQQQQQKQLFNRAKHVFILIVQVILQSQQTIVGLFQTRVKNVSKFPVWKKNNNEEEWNSSNSIEQKSFGHKMASNVRVSHLILKEAKRLGSAQLNFNGPWENISTLWQYLMFQLK